MTHRHGPASIRHRDVAIIGGSAAGLAAAIQLGRQRRSVVVVDSGEPRNAPAAHMHGFPGRDGEPPAVFLEAVRREARSYGIEILTGTVEDTTRADGGGFEIDLEDGRRIAARRVIASTGLVDRLPEIEGLAERWGREVIHCPFCHGYEIRDRRVVQIVDHPMGLHQASLFHRLTEQLTVVLHGSDVVDPVAADDLAAAGVEVIRADVVRVVDGTDGGLLVEMEGRAALPADAIVVTPRFQARTGPFESLSPHIESHQSGLGELLVTDPVGATNVPGLYAAGNVTDPGQQVLHAAAHGSRVGGMIAADLAGEDVAAGRRTVPTDPSGHAADWEHRYSGDAIWSGNPNGALVREAESLEPGSALDVGAGEGGDAIWLAERGWTVTAADISARALDRLAAEADSRGLDIGRNVGDVNALDPFAGLTFDLVTAHYASIPRTPDGRATTNLAAAVAPGGTLLFVTHDPEPMRGGHGAFDPDAYVGTDEVAASLDPAEWEIEVDAVVPRPSGSASAAHHVDDVVLRARRIG